jgi:ABC-type transport system substrate-binding protein
VIVIMPVIGAIVIVTSCRGGPEADGPPTAVLRVGVGSQVSATNPILGLRQLSPIFTVEGLARTGEDGRMQPLLAEAWTLGPGRRSLRVKLRPNVKFHDGSPVDANAIESILPNALRTFLGSVYADVDYVRASGPDAVDVAFHDSSPFLIDALEATIQKPGSIGTGPFVAASNSTTKMIANRDYYLGPPGVAGAELEIYPSVRTAWAELLRNRIDMLWEVGPDALASMEKSNSVSVFTFTRRYQYVIVLNPRTPALKSAAVRRGLNLALDRPEIVRRALSSYGVASTGPVWPRHWGFSRDVPTFQFDPTRASSLLAGGVKFSCLIPPDATFERLALDVKRQLAAAGVEIIPEEVSLDELARRAATRQYEALLIELISGPTLVRPYLIWHTEAPLNFGHWGNATVDIALDRVRHAASDEDVRAAIGGLQQAFMDDPPAVFLAWSQRARAVSHRFVVPSPEQGRDILSNLRLWKPTTGQPQASRN